MRYTHSINSIRHRRHMIKVSLILTAILMVLILYLGFTFLDAHQFFLGFAQSFIRVIIAYIISLLLSVGIVLLITINDHVEELAVPFLDALQSFPAFALFPLLIIWFGKGSLDVIIILVIEMIWPILFTLLSAKKQLREDLLEAARVFGARGNQYLLWVLFPLLLPSLITGSIVAWGEAWETIIAAEIIVNVAGVGTYLTQTGETNSRLLVVGLVLLLAILFLFNKYVWLPLLNASTKYSQE